MDKIYKEFTDLLAWQEGHKLVLGVYQLSEQLPASEKYNLVSQLQRAVVSVTSNIAEGVSRRTPKDKVSFFYISLGSLRETQNHLLICKDLGFISLSDYTDLQQQSVQVARLLTGLVKSYDAKITR